MRSNWGNKRGLDTFLRKLRDAVDENTVFQLSTDAYPGYNQTVPAILGKQAHYGQIIKMYGVPNPNEVRYSAAECIGCKKDKKIGNPRSAVAVFVVVPVREPWIVKS